MRTIRGVRRYFVLLALSTVLLMTAAPRMRALTDEEKRQEFLDAQGSGSGDDSSPTPAPHHHKHSGAEPTPHHKHTPAPRESPDVTPTPEPGETPRHHHHAAEEEVTPARRRHPTPEPDETPRKHLHHEERPAPAPAPQQVTPAPQPYLPPEPQVTPAPPEPARTPEPHAAQQPYTAPAAAAPAPTAIPRAVAAPTPAPGPWGGGGAQVDIEKEGLEQQGGLEPPPPEPPTHHHWWQFFTSEPAPHYQFLTKAVRDAIDRAPVARRRWRFIVVHNSGTRQGNARIFDYYHRYVRKMPNGLAYHFVIGNGTSSGNGQIEIGNRWTRQINGGHVHSDYLNNIALGICLVGDFNRDHPTKEQLEALDELIRYLRNRVGKIDGKPAIVKAHKEINPPQWPTDCPGDKFPYEWLHSRFG